MDKNEGQIFNVNAVNFFRLFSKILEILENTLEILLKHFGECEQR
jgi:hypothetical protein